MRAKVSTSYLGLITGYLRTKTLEEGRKDGHEQLLVPTLQLSESVSECLLIHLPDDILLLLLQYLPLSELISWEQVCTRLRDLMVQYGVYKTRLDLICRRKKINNYMELSDRARESRSGHEVSAYYKVRLYHYTNKWAERRTTWTGLYRRVSEDSV